MDASAVPGKGEWDATLAEHKQRQLLHIGRVAADLVARDGLTAVSMSTLARAAGVSRATLYNYVPDIGTAIRLYLTAQREAFHTQVVAAVAEETAPEAQLRRYIREQVAYVAGTDHRAAVALTEAGAALAGPNCDRSPRHTIPTVLQRILDDGVAAHVFTRAASAVQATLITRLLYSAHELLHHHGLSQSDTAAAITDLILDGIRPQQPNPRPASSPDAQTHHRRPKRAQE